VRPSRFNPRLRPFMRLMAGMTPDQRRRALSPAGLALADMALEQQQELIRLNADFLQHPGGPDPRLLAGAHFRASYLPAGWYVWSSRRPGDHRGFAAPTAEGALAAARQVNPAAGPEQVGRTDGDLVVTLALPDGSGWNQGSRGIWPEQRQTGR